jgi:Tfp pilus assembly protein PilF
VAGSPLPRRLLVATLLALAVAGVFWPILGNGFVDYDDDEYLTANPWVQQGLTRESLRWAWTTGHVYWQPLTWTSHIVDWELFGTAPAGHHAVSLAYHVANTVLVFLLLERTTAATWRSALVAALFGLHPLRVESVAWAAELKDVLSTFLWLLTTHAWVSWTRRPGVGRYLLVLLGLTLGLLAKPMLVTLPFTLLLLDYWPLGRLRTLRDAWPRVREKLPLVPLVAALSVITIAVQGGGPTLGSLDTYPLWVRAANAIVSYAEYLWMAIWPHDLSILYVHPGAAIPPWKVAASLLVLIAVSVVSVATRRTWPWLLFGWLWYLGTLVPVIGLVQAGEQAMADRFTYVPLLGVFIAVAWALPPWPVLATAAATAVVACALVTRAQLPVWRDATTVFGHAVAIDPGNAIAHMNLAVALVERDQLGAASGHYEASVRLRPSYAQLVLGFGNAALDAGRPDRAAAHYEAVARALPDNAAALNNLGRIAAQKGDTTGALAWFEAAARAEPRNTDALNNLGAVLVGVGRAEEGLASIDRALAVRRDNGRAWANRVLALVALRRSSEAWQAVAQARTLGTEPAPQVLAALRAQMPEPAAP